MYLIRTALKDTSFCVEFIKDQVNKAPGAIDPTTMTFNGNWTLLSKFPIGTVFITNDISWGDLTSNIGDDIYPLFKDSTSFFETKASTENVEYALRWAISSRLYEEFELRAMYYHFSEKGYPVNYDETIVEYKSDTTGSLKDQISRLYPCPTIAGTGFSIEPQIWNLLVRNVMKGENCLLVGPTGSGKTEIVRHLAEAMSKRLSIQDMGTIQDAQSALLGVHRLNKDGHSEFEQAPFVHNVQQEGILLLDEMNRAPLSAANILFPCLDTRRYLPIDIACSDGERVIPINKDCVFFATANLGSEYSGTTQIDRALLDRFFPIELTYPNEQAEINILKNRTGVDDKIAKSIVKVSKTIRKQFAEQELSNVISVRHTLLAASLIKDGFDATTALLNVILPLFEESNGVSERTKVKSIIAAH